MTGLAGEELRVSSEALQAWISGAAALLAGLVGVFKYFNYRTRRDRKAAVGASFSATIEALASDNETRRMAAAVLLRRFFDRETEQGEAGRPYLKETVEVIAGMLRETQPERTQKVLADGLRYAGDLIGADLQRCNLRNAYLGVKKGDRGRLNVSRADFFEADCTGASLRGVVATEAVFFRATLEKTVLIGADLERTNFREARLAGAKFQDARIAGAEFEGALDIPDEVATLLDERYVARSDAIVPSAGGR